MKRTILTSIAAIAMAMPAIAANIPNDATCNSGVLGVSSGSANLEADYTANTINITWDGNGGSTPTGGATSCTYDSTFNLPAAPTKTGYTFAGWAVQAAAQCSLSGLDTSVNGIDYAAYQLNNQCYYYFYEYNEETDEETEIEEDDCSNAVFSGLNGAGEWKTNFSYGTVKGIAKCSSTNGTYAQTGTPSDTDGQYCWCQATSYTATGSSQCNVASPSWVFYNGRGSASNCASYCALGCTNGVRNNSDFRRALFGIQ